MVICRQLLCLQPGFRNGTSITINLEFVKAREPISRVWGVEIGNLHF